MALYKCKYHNKEFGERCVVDSSGREKESCELFCFDPDDVISVAYHLKEYVVVKDYKTIFPEEFLDMIMVNTRLYKKFIESRQGSNIFAFIQLMYATPSLEEFVLDFYSTIRKDYFKHADVDVEISYCASRCSVFTKEKIRASMPDIDISGAYGDEIMFRNDQSSRDSTVLEYGNPQKKLTGIVLYSTSTSQHAMWIVVNNYTKEIFFVEPNFGSEKYNYNYGIYFNYFADNTYPTYKKITSEEIGKKYGYLAQSATNNNTCTLWSMIICLYIIINYDKPIKIALGYIIDAKEYVGPMMLLFLYYAHVLSLQNDSLIVKHKDAFIGRAVSVYELYVRDIKRAQPHLSKLPLLNLNTVTLNDAYLAATITYVLGNISGEENMRYLLEWDPKHAETVDIVDLYNACENVIGKNKNEPRLFGVNAPNFIGNVKQLRKEYITLIDNSLYDDPYDGVNAKHSVEWLLDIYNGTYMEASLEFTKSPSELINPFSKIKSFDIPNAVEFAKSDKIMKLFKIVNKKYGNATGFRAMYEKIIASIVKELGVDANFKVVELEFDNMKRKDEIAPEIWDRFYFNSNEEPDSVWWPVDLETGNIANNVLYSRPIVLFRLITGNKYSWLLINQRTKEIAMLTQTDDKCSLFVSHILRKYKNNHSYFYYSDTNKYFNSSGPRYVSYSWNDIINIFVIANNMTSMKTIISKIVSSSYIEYARIGLFWYLIYNDLHMCNDLKEAFHAEQLKFCFSRLLEHNPYIINRQVQEYSSKNKIFIFATDIIDTIRGNINKLVEFSNSNIAQKICSSIISRPTKYFIEVYSDITADLTKNANIPITVDFEVYVVDSISGSEAKNRIPGLANYITTDDIVRIPNRTIDWEMLTARMNVEGLNTHGYINIISYFDNLSDIVCIIVNHNTREVILNESIENFKDGESYIPYVKFFVDTYCPGYELKRVLSMVAIETINKFSDYASKNKECAMIYHLINMYVMVNYNSKLERQNIEDILALVAEMSGFFWFYLFILRSQRGSRIAQILN